MPGRALVGWPESASLFADRRSTLEWRRALPRGNAGAASRSSHRARDIPAHFEQTWFYPKNNSAAEMLQYVHGQFIRANFARFVICLCRAGHGVARVLTAVPHALGLWHTQRTEARVFLSAFFLKKADQSRRITPNDGVSLV